MTMTIAHKLILYVALGILAISLILPGVMEMLRPAPGNSGLVATGIEAKNHLRALNAMIAALGLVALWGIYDLERARPLVIVLGVVMALLVVARVYSIVVDGWPGRTSLLYLAVEAVLAAILLLWPPPASG